MKALMSPRSHGFILARAQVVDAGDDGMNMEPILTPTLSLKERVRTELALTMEVEPILTPTLSLKERVRTELAL